MFNVTKGEGGAATTSFLSYIQYCTLGVHRSVSVDCLFIALLAFVLLCLLLG